MIRPQGDGIQYQALTEPVMPPTTQSVGAGWMGSCLPPTRRPWMAALTVAACILPSTFAQGAINPPTGWRPNYPDRIARKTSVQPQRFSFAVEQINENPGNPGGASISTGSLPILQYQSIAAPMEATSPPPSNFSTQIPVVLADQIFARSTIHASLQQFYAADKFTAPTAAVVTANSWSPSYPDQLLRIRQTPLQASEFVPAIAPFLDLQWRGRYPDQHLVRPNLARFIWPQPHFVVQIDVPVMSWTGLYLDPPVLRKAQRQPQGVTGPLNPSLFTQATAVPDLSWAGTYPERVWPRRPQTFAQPNPLLPLFISDQTNPVTALSWTARYPDRVPAPRRLVTGANPAYTADKFTAPQAAVVPDQTVAVYPNRVYARPRPTWAPSLTWPDFVPDVSQPVTGLSWRATYPAYIWPRTSLRTAAQLALMIDAQIAPPIIPVSPATGANFVAVPRRNRTATVPRHERTARVPRSKRGQQT